MARKILLIRFSSIGDIVLTTPVIRCLKRQLVDVEIHVLTHINNKTLFDANPYIDKLFVFDGSFKTLLPQLKAENYAHIVDLHKNIRSLRVKLSLGKPSSSFPKLNVKKYLLVRSKIDRMPRLHIVDRYFESVKKLGVVNDGQGLDYFIPEHKQVDIKTNYPVAARGYYAVVVGGKHKTKIFPAEQLIKTAVQMKKPLLLLGGPDDYRRAQMISEAFPENSVNLCGKLDLHQSASVIRQSDAVLTNDTGLMHIAAALRRPIVSVWGNTVPQFGMYPYMPSQDHLSKIIEIKRLSCRPCSKIGFEKCPKGHFKCMMDIDPAEVAREMNGF
jgi:ADP-heptose:LPS heptosyltransferase